MLNNKRMINKVIECPLTVQENLITLKDNKNKQKL